MNRRAGSALLMALGSLPAQSIDVALELPATLAFGAPFGVVVTRHWPPSLQVEAFDPAQLVPLSVTPRAVEQLPDGERLRYVARALVVGEVALAPLHMRWLEGAVVRSVACTVPPFAVLSILPTPPGELEWPPDVLELPRGGHVLWLGLVALASLGVAWWWWRRAPATEAPPLPTHEVAWNAARELDALLVPTSGAASEAMAFHLAIKAIVREHCARTIALPATVRTSEELVAAVTRGRDELRACLLVGDLVLFAARDGTSSAPVGLAMARAFVRATS